MSAKQNNIAPRWVFILGALTLWLANVFLHLEFSFWITSNIATGFGEIQLRDYFEHAAIIAIFFIVVNLWRKAKQGVNVGLTLTAWCGWLLFVVCSMLWLLTTQIEAIHFFQYALITWCFCKALDPKKADWPLLSICLFVCLLGIVDELNQYFYLAAVHGFYVDFNDFVLNQLGVLGGLLFYYGFSLPLKYDHNEAVWIRTPQISLMLLAGLGYTALMLLLLIGYSIGVISFEPIEEVPPGGILTLNGSSILYLQRLPGLLGSWQPSFSDSLYYVLSPLEGSVAVMIGFVCVVSYSHYSMRKAA